MSISRSDSSKSDRNVNNKKSLKYFFEQIQKLKNLSPEEYIQQ